MAKTKACKSAKQIYSRQAGRPPKNGSIKPHRYMKRVRSK